MNNNLDPQDPRLNKRKKGNQNSYDKASDITTGQESGKDALLQSSPTDSSADEKVIVNSSQENKIVNSPSQTSAGINKEAENDEANL